MIKRIIKKLYIITKVTKIKLKNTTLEIKKVINFLNKLHLNDDFSAYRTKMNKILIIIFLPFFK